MNKTFLIEIELFGEKQPATIKVNAAGWGEIYDKQGYYCGSANPYKTMLLLNK